MKTGQLSIIRFVIFLLCLGLSMRAIWTIVDLWHRKDIMVERQIELTRRTKENKELERQLQEISTDQYIETVARNTLGLVKAGEAIVILPGAGSRSSGQVKGGERVLNWQKWWGLFF